MVPSQLPGLGQAAHSTQRMLDHTALVNEARESREKLGYMVYTEDQNSFRLRGLRADGLKP